MAIFSYRMGERISRSRGQSAVRVAAYQARERLVDERTGYSYNHRPREQTGQEPASEAKSADATREGIAAASAYIGREAGYEARRKPALFVGLYAPSGAPDWCRGRENIERFWNEAEKAERRQDAQIAERIIVALPHELTLQQNVWLLQDHIKEFTRAGRVVQVAIHAPEHGDGRNVHAHLLVSTRGVDESGFKMLKPEARVRYLHRREYVQDLRARWEQVANHHLARHGHEARIDHRTLAGQGIDRAPTIHLGPGDSRRERQGDRSAAGEINREIATQNAQHATAEVVDLDAWRASLERERQEAARMPQERPEAAQGQNHENHAAGASPRSAAPQRDQEATPEARDDRRREIAAEARAIDAWRSGVEREWQGQGSPVKPIAPDREEEAQRERLERIAWLDRKPGSRAALTVEDVARELAPDYRDAMAEGQKQTGAIAKAEGQVAGARKNRAIAEANIEDRQRQMPGWRRALHGIGWEDTELSKWQTQVKIADVVEERGLTHRTTAQDALRLWERRAEAALEAVRPAAARELAQRQERAENARAQLVRRGAWIGEPEEAYGVERDDLAAWHGFRAGEMCKAAEKKAQKAVPKPARAQATGGADRDTWRRGVEQNSPQAQRPAEKKQAAQIRRPASERQEEAMDRYVQGMIARSRSHPGHETEDERLKQRQRHGHRQRL